MIRAILTRGAAFALLWWALAEGRGDGWVLGALAAAAAAWASVVLLPPGGPRIRLAGLSGFAAFFVWTSIRGAVQVARMAMIGRRALEPGTLELPVRLPHGGPRTLLVCALGLMPGTVGIDLAGDTMRLHVLDVRQPLAAELRALEAAIARLFGNRV